MAALRPQTRAALARGADLYRAGRHFEAHDAWEEAWRREAGDVRALLHGLIHLSAALVKALRDARPRGAVRHLERARALLAPLPDPCAGVALSPLLEDLELALGAARRWRDGGASGLAAAPPRVEIAATAPRA